MPTDRPARLRGVFDRICPRQTLRRTEGTQTVYELFSKQRPIPRSNNKSDSNRYCSFAKASIYAHHRRLQCAGWNLHAGDCRTPARWLGTRDPGHSSQSDISILHKLPISKDLQDGRQPRQGHDELLAAAGMVRRPAPWQTRALCMA